MKPVTVIGAGKTGRGFIGRLLAEAGAEITFVDRDAALVEELARQGHFTVHFFGGSRPPVTISGYRACTWETADLSQAELILVSVCGPNLRAVGEALRERLPKNRNSYIIVCENAAHPAETLQEALALPAAAVSEATVFCTTVEGEGLDIDSEDYPYLQADGARLRGYVPEIPAIQAVENFGGLLTRKLFTYNAASCIIAYMGWFYGYSDYGAAANDPRILELLDRNYAVTNRVLCREFGYDPKEQEAFALLSKKKFCDRTIVDTVARNAREPQRKLGPQERVIGPMLAMERQGEDTAALEMTAAAMLLYDNEGEEAWRKLKAAHTPRALLRELGGLPEGPLLERILNRYAEMQKEYAERNAESKGGEGQ